MVFLAMFTHFDLAILILLHFQCTAYSAIFHACPPCLQSVWQVSILQIALKFDRLEIALKFVVIGALEIGTIHCFRPESSKLG